MSSTFSKLLVFVIALPLTSSFVLAQTSADETRKNYESFYNGYHEFLKEDPIINWGILHGLYEIRIFLPEDRTRYGELVLGKWEQKGNFLLGRKKFKKLLGPYRVLGRSNSTKASNSTNQYYGDSPLGDYYGWAISPDMISLVFPTLSSGDLGKGGAILLSKNEEISRANTILDPDRKELIIHGGELVENHLSPTYGAIRMEDEDILELVINLQYLFQYGRLSDTSPSEMIQELNSEAPGVTYDAYRIAALIRIRESNNFLKKKGPDPTHDSTIQYSPKYVDPIPISNYSAFQDYVFIKSIGERGYLKQVSQLVNYVKLLDSKYSEGSINKSDYIKDLKARKDDLIKIHGDMSLYLRQNNIDRTQLETASGTKVFEWRNYLNAIMDYVNNIQSYVSGLETNSNEKGPNDTCFLVESKCNLIILTCKYKCYPSGIVYEKSCGGCFIFSF